MSGAARPACLITGTVSDYRVEPFRVLCREQDVEVVVHDGPGAAPPDLAVVETTQAGAARLAASGRYRAVVAGLGGRVALPGAYLGARRARVPFVLWASVWAHPRTLAHALSRLPTRQLYRRADAVATYGPHVSRHVAAHRGGAGRVFEAPQAAGPPFPAEVADDARREARERMGATAEEPVVLFAGRLEAEKGVHVLLEAWRQVAGAGNARLAFAGDGALRGEVDGAGPAVGALGHVERGDLPALYAAADALVLPSVPTATFLEPWGLVVNEAMHQGTPIIASDAVGAVAGGLVRDGRNGLVVPAGDAGALADAISTLTRDSALRERLGQAAARDVAPYTPEAWARGMAAALAAAGGGRA